MEKTETKLFCGSFLTVEGAEQCKRGLLQYFPECTVTVSTVLPLPRIFVRGPEAQEARMYVWGWRDAQDFGGVK